MVHTRAAFCLPCLMVAAGSYALKGATLPNDSGVVAKLRAAGAIILGKANMSEWAGARSSHSTSGWSADGGQTTGAYYPNEDPNGSSTGSGVSVSVGLAIAALGTDVCIFWHLHVQADSRPDVGKHHHPELKEQRGRNSTHFRSDVTKFDCSLQRTSRCSWAHGKNCQGCGIYSSGYCR